MKGLALHNRQKIQSRLSSGILDFTHIQKNPDAGTGARSCIDIESAALVARKVHK
jgi:hypothetical protein